jgi:YVTN family beta-propeller protein
VANQEGRALAAVDLGVFAVAKHIPLDADPSAVLSSPVTGRVYALTPDGGHVHEIDAEKLERLRSTGVARQARGMRLAPDGATLYVLCGNPRRLVALSLTSLKPQWSVALAGDPLDFDVSNDGNWIAISYGAEGWIQLLDTARRGSGRRIETGGQAGVLRFQSDSSQLIAANAGERMLNIYQTATGRLVTKLPLSLRPDRFCFNADGGQLFVTGEGMDAVVVVYPYFTPQIGETVLAGHAPGAMAASQDFLFVANSESRDVSILDAASKKVVAVAPAGNNPGFITITPDGQYALVLNQDSGDMGVIWIPGVSRSVARSRDRTAALFTMIPVGSKPVSAAVVRV